MTEEQVLKLLSGSEAFVTALAKFVRREAMLKEALHAIASGHEEPSDYAGQVLKRVEQDTVYNNGGEA